MSAEEIAEFPKKAVELKLIEPEYAEDLLTNPFTGQPVRYERSPGNFSTRRVGDEIYFCLYDRYGREVRVVALPPPPKSAVGVGDKEVE